MRREEIKGIIMNHINEQNHVTYVELERLFQEHGYNYKGTYDILSEKSDHVLFWSGWNKETIELINELQEEKKIHKEPAQFITYLIDGGGMNLPLVKTAREYKRDHWLPVVFCRGPQEVHNG